MSLSKVTRNGQVTIPKEIRERLNLEEGDYVEVTASKDGILMRPKKVRLVDPGQAHYWTDDWQDKESRADEDIQLGRIHKLGSPDELDD